MRTKPMMLALGLCLLLSSYAASAQVSAQVRIGGGYYPPRAYYGPRYYPRPAVVVAPPVYMAPLPVVVYPAPYYARPYYARPYYGRPRYYGRRGGRW